jgi:hypothetical protein
MPDYESGCQASYILLPASPPVLSTCASHQSGSSVSGELMSLALSDYVTFQLILFIPYSLMRGFSFFFSKNGGSSLRMS